MQNFDGVNFGGGVAIIFGATKLLLALYCTVTLLTF